MRSCREGRHCTGTRSIREEGTTSERPRARVLGCTGHGQIWEDKVYEDKKIVKGCAIPPVHGSIRQSSSFTRRVFAALINDFLIVGRILFSYLRPTGVGES